MMGRKKGYKHSEESKRKMSFGHMGNIPFNKGKTYEELYGIQKAKEKKLNQSLVCLGKHLSPKTEFKKGNHHSKKTEFKLYDFGKSKIKRINGKDINESHLVWCKANQLHRVPFVKEGLSVIHHIDGDRGNNKIENLQLMTKDFHSKLHITNKMEEIN